MKKIIRPGALLCAALGLAACGDDSDYDLSTLNEGNITPRRAQARRTMRFTPAEVDVKEGTEGSLQLALIQAPSEPLTVYVKEVSENDYVTVKTSSLSFTPDNFATPQTVTVVAADADGDKKSPTIKIQAWAEGYLTTTGRVRFIDDDRSPLTAALSGEDIKEGGTANAIVALPLVAGSDTEREKAPTDLPMDITFTPAGKVEAVVTTPLKAGASDAMIKLTALQDDDNEDDTVIAKITLTGPGAELYQPVELSVKVADDDTGIKMGSKPLNTVQEPPHQPTGAKTEGEFSLKLVPAKEGVVIKLAPSTSGALTLASAGEATTDASGEAVFKYTVAADNNTQDEEIEITATASVDTKALEKKLTFRIQDRTVQQPKLLTTSVTSGQINNVRFELNRPAAITVSRATAATGFEIQGEHSCSSDYCHEVQAQVEDGKYVAVVGIDTTPLPDSPPANIQVTMSSPYFVTPMYAMTIPYTARKHLLLYDASTNGNRVTELGDIPAGTKKTYYVARWATGDVSVKCSATPGDVTVGFGTDGAGTVNDTRQSLELTVASGVAWQSATLTCEDTANATTTPAKFTFGIGGD